MSRLTFAIALAMALPRLAVPQANLPSASPQQRIALRYFHEVLDGGKAEVLEELLLPDCVIHRPEGELKGLAAMRNMLAARRANFSTFTTQVHDIFESGDRVAVRVTHQGTVNGAYRFRIGAHDVSGKTLRWDAIVIFRFRNGRVAEEWVSRDELGMLLSADILKSSSGKR